MEGESLNFKISGNYNNQAGRDILNNPVFNISINIHVNELSKDTAKTISEFISDVKIQFNKPNILE